MFFLVFAIFGVSFLKGTFYECDLAAESYKEEFMDLVTYPRPMRDMSNVERSWLDVDSSLCSARFWNDDFIPTSKEICNCLPGGQWVKTIQQNFDNTLRGFSLLFEISTTEGWVDVMNASIDQRGIDMQPVRDNNRLWALYYVLFLVLGSFFMVELFVGVIIEYFAKIRDTKGQGLMTDAQRQWASTQAFVMKIRPEKLARRPTSCKLRTVCFDIVNNLWFDRVVVAIIAANSVSIASTTFGENDSKIKVVGIINGIFSSIFIGEAILKIMSFGVLYFRSGWNRFDFAIVCGLVVGFVLNQFITDHLLLSSISSILGFIRIGRLFRLVRFIKPLRTPINAIVHVIPGMTNIGALVVLLFFVYAVCGMQLYGTVAIQGDMNEQANFRTIANAMTSLFRFSTGENWNGFMWSLFEEREDCETDLRYDEKSPWCVQDRDYPDCTEINGCSAGVSVFFYFYTFTLIVSYVILNMFVGVVLESFQSCQEGDILQPADLDHFVKIWAKFDPGKVMFQSFRMFSSPRELIPLSCVIIPRCNVVYPCVGHDTTFEQTGSSPWCDPSRTQDRSLLEWDLCEC